MSNPVETAVTDAKADLAAVASDVKAVGVDIKTMFVSRVNDAILAAIVLGSIWLGHHL